MKAYERPELEVTSLMTQENMAGPSDYIHEDSDDFDTEE